MNWFIDQEVELTKGAIAGEKRTNITPLAYPGSANAHQWRVYVKNHGIPFDLTGNTVTAYFQRSDGNVVVVQGDTIDNMAYVIIPAEVYAIPGIVKAYMDVVLAGSAITPVAGITFNVPQNMSGDIIDPGEVIPASLEELLAEIDAMREATAEARAVVSSSVRYDAAQTLTDAQKERARGNIDAASEDDIADLKSATRENATFKFEFESGKYNESNSGAKIASVAKIRNKNLIPARQLAYIAVPNGYSFQLHRFSASGAWMSYASAWVDNANKSDFGDAGYIGLSIRNTSTPNADISGQILTVQNGMLLYTETEKNEFSIAHKILIESGKYDENASGTKIASLARLRNTFLISVSGIDAIILPTGYDMQVHQYDASKGWIGYSSDWVTEFKGADIDTNTRYVGLTIRKTASPNADISADATTVQNGIVVHLTSKYVLDRDTYNQLFNASYVFETGKYDEDNHGAKKASWGRIRNTNLIPLDYVTHITFPSPYVAQVHFFDASGVWIGYSVDWTSYFDVSQVSTDIKYIGLTIRNENTPSADIRSEVSTVQSGTVFATVLGEHKSISDIYIDVVENLRQTRRTKNVSKNNYLTRNKPLTLFHFSDIHQEQGNLRDIVNFAAENSDLIDNIICTGDIVGARFQNGMTWFNGVPGAENILLAIGNHDVMNAASGYDDSQTATLAQVYAQFIAPYYANWDLSSDPSSGVTYYYKDYPNSKVRLIVIDCMLDSVDASADVVQYAWFADTLASAVAAGYYVVVANHCFPTGASFIESNWTNADYQSPQTYLDAKYPEAVDNFIGNGGHFVCWLEGHSHADYYMNYVGTHGTQMALSVDAASRFNAEGFTDVNRLEQDRSYNSANLVTVDTGAEVIKVVKFGALSNYKLIPRKTLTLGFDGSIIVQN